MYIPWLKCFVAYTESYRSVFFFIVPCVNDTKFVIIVLFCAFICTESICLHIIFALSRARARGHIKAI